MNTEIQKVIKKQGLIISRLPLWAKEIFIVRAKEEFCDDYGMCLAAMVKESGEYNLLKQKFFEGNLPIKLQIDSPVEDDEQIKFGNGKLLNKEGGKKHE